MATTQPEPAAAAGGYRLEGCLLEVCSCDVLCPCWIGEDPDQGACDAVVAYHFDSGTIRGVDVGGLTLVGVAHIPGNVLEGNWRQVVYVDDQASDEQADAILDAFSGSSAGRWPTSRSSSASVSPSSARRSRTSSRTGRGTLTVGDKVHAAMHPYTGPDGSTTTLNDSSSRPFPARRPTSAWPTARRSTSRSTVTMGVREEERDPVRLEARLRRGLIAAIAAAWVAAVVAAVTGAASLFHHDGLIEGGVAAGSRCPRSCSRGSSMLAAMMLPTACRSSASSRARPQTAAAAGGDRRFLGGYAISGPRSAGWRSSSTWAFTPPSMRADGSTRIVGARGRGAGGRGRLPVQLAEVRVPRQVPPPGPVHDALLQRGTSAAFGWASATACFASAAAGRSCS